MIRYNPDLLPDDAHELLGEERAERRRRAAIRNGEPPEPEEEEDEDED